MPQELSVPSQSHDAGMGSGGWGGGRYVTLGREVSQPIFPLLRAKFVRSPIQKHKVCATEVAQPLKGLP